VILNLYCSSHAFDSRSFWIHIVTYLHNYSLTPWSRVLEKLTGSQLVKKFLHFMEPRSSLLCVQESTTCPYPEPDQSSPSLLSHFLKILLNTNLPSTPGSSYVGFFPQVSPPKPCMHLSCPPYQLHPHPFHFLIHIKTKVCQVFQTTYIIA